MLALLLATPGLAAPEWTEADLARLTEHTIGVLPWHQYVLRSMMRLDKPHLYSELALWAAPGRFDFEEPEPIPGALMRFGLGLGLGAGRPRTGFSMFGGMQVDYGMAQEPPIFDSDGTLGSAVEGILYGGVAYKGFVATYGTVLGQPFTLADAETTTITQTQMINVYNQEGVAIGGVAAPKITGEVVLAALRTEIAPERLLERLDLRQHGLFRTGVARYERGTNPYLDP